MKTIWLLFIVALLLGGVSQVCADPAVNRAFAESQAKISNLRTQFKGDELRQKLRAMPLLSSDELKTLNPNQQLKLRDKRLDAMMKTYAEIDQEEKSTANEQAASAPKLKKKNPIDDDNNVYITDENGNKKVVSLDEIFQDRGTAQQAGNAAGNGSVEGIPIKDNFLSGMLDEKMKQQLSIMMKQNPLSQVPKEEIEAKIDLNSEGTAMGAMMKKNPKIKKFLVEVAHDEKALPGLISIINKPDEMKYYGFTLGAIFVVAFLINLNNTKGNLLNRIVKKLMLGAGTFTANIAAFYFFFQDEITPTFQVAGRVFFG